MGIRYEPDRIRIDVQRDYGAALRDDICDICGCRYSKHAPVSGYEWLTRLCDGELVTLR